jgi:hypothetical protein
MWKHLFARGQWLSVGEGYFSDLMGFRRVIAFSELLSTEAAHSSGFFLKKKPP